MMYGQTARSIVLPLWMSLCACLAAFGTEQSAVLAPVTGVSPTLVRSGPPGEVLPRILFLTPINATWAANHAEEWKRRGVSGFLLQGILDDLAPFPGESAQPRAASAAAQPEPPRPPQWEPLVQEITAARRRLTDGGIDANFLQMSLAPESAWYSDGAAASRARDRFALAGEFCALTGLRGLALDTMPAGGINDFRWNGYRPGQTEERLRNGARRFAVRTLRAFIRACPKGEILLLADSMDHAGPLWFSFLDGAVEALGDAAELRLRLVLRDTATLTEPVTLADAADRENRRVLDHLDKDNRARWEHCGGIVLCLAPVDAQGETPQFRYPVEQFRLLRDLARMRSSEFVCVNAPHGGWWSVPVGEVEQFAELRQGGAARVRVMPPPPPALDAFVFNDPFDGAWRAGRLPFQKGEADILIDKDGAMAVVWDGLREPFRIETRQSLIPVTRLGSDQKDYIMPKDGAAIVPATDGPVLVGGLPLGTYALPASMWLRTDTPLEPGAARSVVHFGLRNPTPAALRGSLRLLPPESHSVGAALFPLSLVRGEKTAFDRTLQGMSQLGETYRFNLAFEVPDLPPTTRSFYLPVSPARVWHDETDGVPNGPPATVRDARTNTTRIFWASPLGDVGCNELRGGLLWKQRLKGNLCQGPVGLSTAVGAVTVVGNDKGRVWFLDGDGGLRLETALGGTPVKDSLRAQAFLPNESESLLALFQDGSLVRLAQVGSEVWRVKTGLKDGRIGRMTGPRGAFGTACLTGLRGTGEGGPAHWAAAGIDAAGSVLWRTDLPAAVTEGPVSEHSAAEVRSWRVGLKNGNVVELDAAKGGSNATWKMPEGLPVTALAGPLVSDDAKCSPVSVIAANDAGVCAFGRDEAPLWSLPLSKVCCMATSPGGEMAVAGTDSGELVCINADGTVRWRDNRSAGAICGITILPIAGGRCAVLYTSADRFITALNGGPLRPAL